MFRCELNDAGQPGVDVIISVYAHAPSPTAVQVPLPDKMPKCMCVLHARACLKWARAHRYNIMLDIVLDCCSIKETNSTFDSNQRQQPAVLSTEYICIRTYAYLWRTQVGKSFICCCNAVQNVLMLREKK